jgi:hypothetical protein
MPAQVDLRTELDDIVEQLTAQGIPAALDRDKVQLPGVWVTSGPVSLDGLSFYTIHSRLIVIAADRDAGPVLDDMTAVVNDVLSLWNPVDDLTPVTVRRAGGELPALSIPVDFRCDYPSDP